LAAAFLYLAELYLKLIRKSLRLAVILVAGKVIFVANRAVPAKVRHILAGSVVRVAGKAVPISSSYPHSWQSSLQQVDVHVAVTAAPADRRSVPVAYRADFVAVFITC
jgi:hypothetical protein